MRRVLFENEAFEEFTAWASESTKTFERLARLIEEAARRTPFVGTGKPEPLKHQFKGCWSRRIDGEHRLVYTVSDEFITIIACREHY
ncbi:MAG: Txe/YoeB family addiction module toxin [Cytophagaceae bacterium]|nr:Txe/YoeB family addiction module toxin [Cytophagaceae bacterium]